MIKAFYLLVFIVTVSGCEKDKLKGESSILIGNWQWSKTEKEYSLCSLPSYQTELNSMTEGVNYEMALLEKGKVIFFENGKEFERYRIVLTLFGGPGCDYLNGYSYFGIDLDNNDELDLDGCVSQDTIVILRGFPFPDPADGCENYTSYFFRE
jgi:hypothetical protein